MEKLPDAILTRILSHLDLPSLLHCALLNRRFNRLASQPQQKRHISLRAEDLALDDSLDCLPTWLPPTLAALEIDGSIGSINTTLVNNNSLFHLISRCPCLQILTLTGLTFKGSAESNPLVAVGRFCSNLRELRLLHCFKLLSSDSLTHLLAGCPRLRRLKLEVVEFADLEFCKGRFCELLARMVSVTVNADALGEFEVWRCWSNCTRLTDLCLATEDEMELTQAITLLPNLVSLRVRNLEMTDEIAEERIPKSLPSGRSCKLRRLELTECYQLTECGLRALLAACPEMRELQLCESENLGVNGVRLAAGVKSLTRLEFMGGPKGLSDADLSHVTFPAGLTHLSLGSSYPFGLPPPQAGPHLQSALADCRALTDVSISLPCNDDLPLFLLTHLPRLRRLKLGSCRRLTPGAWTKLRSLRPDQVLPDLHELRLVSNPGFTDAAAAALCASPVARGLRVIHLLDFTRSMPLTKASIADFVAGCPWLVDMWLWGCVAPDQAAWQEAVGKAVHQLGARGFKVWVSE